MSAVLMLYGLRLPVSSAGDELWPKPEHDARLRAVAAERLADVPDAEVAEYVEEYLADEPGTVRERAERELARALDVLLPDEHGNLVIEQDMGDVRRDIDGRQVLVLAYQSFGDQSEEGLALQFLDALALFEAPIALTPCTDGHVWETYVETGYERRWLLSEAGREFKAGDGWFSDEGKGRSFALCTRCGAQLPDPRVRWF